MPGLTPYGLPYPIAGDSLQSAVQSTPQALATAIEALVVTMTNTAAPINAAPSSFGAGVADGAVAEPTRAFMWGRHVDLALFVKATAAQSVAGWVACTMPAAYRPTRTWRGVVRHQSGATYNTELVADGRLFIYGNMAINEVAYGTISWAL